MQKKIGFSWKRIRKSLRSKRDETKFQQGKKEIEELEKERKLGLINLFYFDESGFPLDPVVPYAWQVIGQQIEIPASNSKRLNVLGFLSTDHHQFHSFCFECSVNTEIVIACFDSFCKTLSNKTTVVIDNASIHTSDQFEENIPKWEEEGLFLKFLPSYSPELNRIEILWKHIKYHWLDFKAYSSFTNLVRHVENILRGVDSQYRINFS